MSATIPPIAPADLKLFYHPPGNLRLTVASDRSYLEVKLFQAWPLSAPLRHLALQDGKGEEIAMIEHLDQLALDCRQVAKEELARRYLTSRVLAVDDIRTEFGVTYWHVNTDRGERDFVVQSMSESCVWMGDQHLLIIDVDGNRFEFVDLNSFDRASSERLATVL